MMMPAEEKLVYTVEEVGALLGLGRSGTYEEVRRYSHDKNRSTVIDTESRFRPLAVRGRSDIERIRLGSDPVSSENPVQQWPNTDRQEPTSLDGAARCR